MFDPEAIARALTPLRSLFLDDADTAAHFERHVSALIRRMPRKSEGEIVSWRAPEGSVFAVDVSDIYALELDVGLFRENVDLVAFLSMLEPGTVVWDIGTNFGLYAVCAARRVGPSGHVFAAEANPTVLDLARRNAKANGVAGNIQFIDAAISDHAGEADFYLSADNAFSGLSFTSRSKLRGKYTVQLKRIDDVWGENGKLPIGAMKIDVEGSEAECLAGATAALAASPEVILLVEASYKNLRDRSFEPLFTFLERCVGQDRSLWLSDRGNLVRVERSEAIRETLPRFSGNLLVLPPSESWGTRLEEAWRLARAKAMLPPSQSEFADGVRALFSLYLELERMHFEHTESVRNFEETVRRVASDAEVAIRSAADSLGQLAGTVEK